MTRLVDVHPTLLMSTVRRGVLTLGAVAALGLGLSGCGGGDQVKTFTPSKIVSFGDEASVLASVAVGGGELKGLKYTVNSLGIYKSFDEDLVFVSPTLPAGGTLSTTQASWVNFPGASLEVPDSLVLHNSDQVERRFDLTTAYTDAGNVAQSISTTIRYQYGFSCVSNRLWIQLLANSYGLGYRSQCEVDSDGATTYAQAGATVDGVQAQVTAHFSELNDSTLVTMLAGQNDILNAYDSADATDVAAAAMKLKGEKLGGIVNSITTTGARVLVVTVPNLSYSPYARADGDAGRARMAALVYAFNDGLLGKNGVKSDGHAIGRVKGYEQVRYMTDDASAYSLTNVTDPVCDPAQGRTPAGATNASSTLYCNSTTLVTGGGAFSYLWADDVNLSPAFHASLGNLAYIRARDNPF